MLEFFKGKKIFITGHTGFKGAWMCKTLINAGAEVTGYSLDPPTKPDLFSITGCEKEICSIKGDIRDLSSLTRAMQKSGAEIALHMAAQAIVRSSYMDPHLTYETNIMGTVNFMESVRASDTVKSVVNVTTDKVYENKEWAWGYRENESLDGFDPYSNSKSCSDIITHCYKRALLEARDMSISTARAGNVIGGGDFAPDRIIPDCVRAAFKGEQIFIRNPNSIRPYQHVLEAIGAYLLIAERQFNDRRYEGSYNVGPDEHDVISNAALASLFCAKWGAGLKWFSETLQGPHEANYLKLDCSKIKSVMGWSPKWNIDMALDKTIEWSKAFMVNSDINRIMNEQIYAYFK